MGGGTGTVEEPNVADIANEAGILTVGVVTKPFKCEGNRRMVQANAGIRELLGKVDSLLIIPNDRLKYATDQKVTLANAFEIADDVLRQAVTSISDLIKNTGFINLDFADVTCIMQNAGYAHMGVGHAAGKGKAEEAARIAVASPLMETSINGAHGVLINITGSSDMGLEDVEAAADLVQEAAHPDANIIFGASFDESMQDEIRVTVIATGFEEGAAQAAAAERAAMARKTVVETPAQEPAAAPAPAAAAPSVPPVFKKAAPAMTPVVPGAAPAPAAAPAAAAEEEPAEDPFDNIFKIFNTK
jgi:cell division protein FtsZ